MNIGVCHVPMYHVLPYATLVWVGKSAFIAFIIVCVQAPADQKGGAPVVRSRKARVRGQGQGAGLRQFQVQSSSVVMCLYSQRTMSSRDPVHTAATQLLCHAASLILVHKTQHDVYTRIPRQRVLRSESLLREC